MSLQLPQAPNAGLFKQGYQSHSNADGALIRNIEAVRQVSSILLTLMGPLGRNKIIVNHLGKIFITNDALTMLNELEVVHPAVKLLIMASQQQQMEMGDHSNLVIVLAGEFLNAAEKLVVLGLSPSEISQGYALANKFVMEAIENLAVDKVRAIGDRDELLKAIRPVIMLKQYGDEDLILRLVIDAVLLILDPKRPSATFNIDLIRVVKVMGSSLRQLQVIKGMVFPREPEGHVKHLNARAKVAIYTCPIDILTTETKGTVLLHNAQEILDFSKGEEQQLEQMCREISDLGVRVVVAGANVGELALHYFNKFGVLVLRVPSKFDLRRISRVCGATPLPRLGAPMPDEMGLIDVIETREIGGDRVTVFRQELASTTRTATVLIRGATQQHLDDIERLIDDGVNAVKLLLQDNRLLPGAGAVEAELMRLITQYGERTPGLLQLAIKLYALAFEVIPRALAETAGLNVQESLSRLYAAHSDASGLLLGLDIDGEEASGLVDTAERGILDLLAAKRLAINLATDAATTVLSIDQIIMAKRAGGPVMPKQPRPGNWDQAD
jgi:T-complex protein 1 subunit theta